MVRSYKTEILNVGNYWDPISSRFYHTQFKSWMGLWEQLCVGRDEFKKNA